MYELLVEPFSELNFILSKVVLLRYLIQKNVKVWTKIKAGQQHLIFHLKFLDPSQSKSKFQFITTVIHYIVAQYL